jgi:hypothetical protein
MTVEGRALQHQHRRAARLVVDKNICHARPPVRAKCGRRINSSGPDSQPSFVIPAKAGIHPSAGAKSNHGFPDFSNEVQHQFRVLRWERNTTNSPWKNGVRLPAYKPKGARSGKSLQLWIARHHELHRFGIATFFCDPYAPWQKGGIENAIGRMRRVIPTKVYLAQLSQNRLADLVGAYNNTPRKCLDWNSPAEVFLSHLLHFKRESTFPLARE